MAGPDTPGMPEPPSGDFYNETQWAVLLALLDAIVPSVAPESMTRDVSAQRRISDAEYQLLLESYPRTMAAAPEKAVFQAYLDERPARQQAFLHACRRSLARLPESGRQKLGGALSLLS
jgi:hypothetical protein